MGGRELWLLLSPALPVGGYSYSQGLETAVRHGWVQDVGGAAEWILGLAREVLTRVDLPLLKRLIESARATDAANFERWNQELLAMRESRELREEDVRMGRALLRLLRELERPLALAPPERLSFAGALTLAGAGWALSLEELLDAYLWIWAENQVNAAVKLVPLGQTDGQRLLLAVLGELEALRSAALARGDDELGMTAPMLGIASALHEAEFPRLFQS